MQSQKELVNSMSYRQSILYAMQLSEQPTEWDNKDETSYVNPNERHDELKFKQREEDLRNHPERWRMLAHSLNEFFPIKKNRFLERNKMILLPKDYPHFSCSCQPKSRALMFQLNRRGGSRNTFAEDEQSYDCGEQCLNRSVAQDCVSEVCPVGDSCRNRRFQLHQNAYVYPVKTENKGWGLCAGEPISKGSFIMQYVGEVFHEDSPIGQKRIEKYKKSTCTYMMRTENGEIIDPTYYGNVARFMNHSCDPNCETRKWTCGKETSVGIFARRDIQEDEELSFDYQFDTFKTPFTKCYCGTSKCKGYLGLATYDKGDGDVNAPVCQLCSDLVETKEQLVVCKGTCDKVFHKACIQEINNRFERLNYFCKRCARTNRAAAKKLREEDEQNQLSDNEQMSDDSQQDNSPAALEKDQNSPAKTPRGRPRNSLKLKQDVTSFPIRDDKECKRFMQKTPENLLLDKVIHREIFQIDQAQKNPYVQLYSDDQMDVDDQDCGDKNMLKVVKPRNFQKKRKMGVFSLYYNFYYEMVKRLKQRMKENRKNFKFRKIYIRARSVAPNKKSSIKKVVVRKKASRSVSKSQVSTTKRKINAEKSNKVAEVKQQPVAPEIEITKVDELLAEIKEPKQTPQATDIVMEERNNSLLEVCQNYEDEEKEESQSLNIDTSYGGEIEEVNSQTMAKWQSAPEPAEVTETEQQKEPTEQKLDEKFHGDLREEDFSPKIDIQKQAEPVAEDADEDMDQQSDEGEEGEEGEECEEMEESMEEEIIEEEIEEEMTEPEPSGSCIESEEESEQEFNLSQTQSEQTNSNQDARGTSSDAQSRSQYSDSAAEQQASVSDAVSDPKAGRAVSEFIKAFEQDKEMREKQLNQEREEAKTEKRPYQRRAKNEEQPIKIPRKRGRPSKVELAERARLQALQDQEYEEEEKEKIERQSKPKERRLRLNKDLAFEGLAGESDPQAEVHKVKRKMSATERKRDSRVRDSKQIQRLAKEKLEANVRRKVENFVEKEIEYEESQETIRNVDLKTTRLNLYEDMFNMVFVKNIDLLEAVSNLYLNWENPWGNLVTLKLTSNQSQFNELLGILQFTIDKMMKYQLLQTPLSQQTQARFKDLSGKTSTSVLPFLVMSLKVPKIFLKKLIGYQEKVLLQLKKVHEVNFSYDERLVTDIVYALDETSAFRIYGKGRDVIKVSTYLQNALNQLCIRTLAVTKEESKFILDNIKEVKSQIDPCEIRVKRHLKDKNDIRHPFFYAPNQSRDVCLIGTQSEVDRAEQRLYEFYRYRLDKPDLTRTSLCVLLPLQLRDDIYDIKKHLLKQVPDVVTMHYLPQMPRRHITLYMTGSWKNLIEAKNALSQITNESIKRLPSLTSQSLEEFQDFTFCQQLRFNFKILKRSVLEESWIFLKFWDTTSVDLKAIAEVSSSTGLLAQFKQDTQDPTAADTQTPFLREAFTDLVDKTISQGDLKEIGQTFFEQQVKAQRDKLLTYLKAYDSETALNALFVLSEENQNLPQICQNLSIEKPLFVQMAFMTIQEILRKQDYPTIQTYREFELHQSAKLEVNKRLERHDRLSIGERERGEPTDLDPGNSKRRSDYPQHYHGNGSPRRSRRSRSRSQSRLAPYAEELSDYHNQQHDQPKTLKLQRFASSRQQFINEPQLLDMRSGGDSERRERDLSRADYERSRSNYYEQLPPHRSYNREQSTRPGGADRYRDSDRGSYRDKDIDRAGRYGSKRGPDYDYDRDRYYESRERADVRQGYRREAERDYERHKLKRQQEAEQGSAPNERVRVEFSTKKEDQDKLREIAHAKQMEKVLMIQKAQKNGSHDQKDVPNQNGALVEGSEQGKPQETGKDKMDNKDLVEPISMSEIMKAGDSGGSEIFASQSNRSEHEESPIRQVDGSASKKKELHSIDAEKNEKDQSHKKEPKESQQELTILRKAQFETNKEEMNKERKLQRCFEAELDVLEQKYPQCKPGLVQAQQLAKTRNFDLQRRSRSRGQSFSPDHAPYLKGKCGDYINQYYKKEPQFVKKKSYDKFNRNNFTSSKQEYYRKKVVYKKYGQKDGYKPGYDQSYHHRPRDEMVFDRRDQDKFNSKYDRSAYPRSPPYHYPSHQPNESHAMGDRFDDSRGPSEHVVDVRYQKPRDPAQCSVSRQPFGNGSDRYKSSQQLHQLSMKDEKRPSQSKQDSKECTTAANPQSNGNMGSDSQYEQQNREMRSSRPPMARQQVRSPPQPHQEGSSGGSRHLRPTDYINNLEQLQVSSGRRSPPREQPVSQTMGNKMRSKPTEKHGTEPYQERNYQR